MASVRKYLEAMELTEAVNTAVEECIRADILKEFLMEHKAEVVAMSIYEYNEEYVRKSLLEDGMETGYNKEFDSGQQIGDARRLVQIVESAMPNFENNLEKTCKILNVSLEEYENAKELLNE